MKLSFKKAKEASLIKWEYAMTTGCTNDELDYWLIDNHNEIYSYRFSCGFCHRWRKRVCEVDCNNCELGIKQGRSCDDDEKRSNYNKWFNAKTKKTLIKYATLIYNDIKSLKEGNK